MGFGNLGRYPRKRSMAISLTWETVPINKYIAYFRAKYMLIMVCIYTEKKNPVFLFFFFFLRRCSLFVKPWISFTQGCFVPRLVVFGRVVLEWFWRNPQCSFAISLLSPREKDSWLFIWTNLERTILLWPGYAQSQLNRVNIYVLHDLSAKGLGTSSEKLRKPSPVQHNYLPN